MKQLEARWAGTDDFVHVDYVANLVEAVAAAVQFQLAHHIRAPEITWLAAETPGVWFAQNSYVTFRLTEP